MEENVLVIYHIMARMDAMLITIIFAINFGNAIKINCTLMFIINNQS